MLINLRQHQRLISEVVDNIWQKGDDWQAWSDYHQRQMQYFVQARQPYAIFAVGTALVTMLSLMLAILSQNIWLWLICLLAACVLIGVGYYLVLYNRVLHELELQSAILFENALAMKNKPWMTVAQKLIDLAAQFVSNKFRKLREEYDQD